MWFGQNHNNYKNDAITAMQIRNFFKVNGYWCYFLPRDERGIDTILQEMNYSVYDKGFWIRTVADSFNFENPNLFSKFGIVIPNQITFFFKIDEMLARKAEIEQKTGIKFDIPQEGDLMFLPLQNKNFKGINYTELTQDSLVDMIKSDSDTMNYMFEITYISDKEFIFNGKSYYYKISCKIYEKKLSNKFEGDADVIGKKMYNDPEPTFDTSGTPVTNKETAPYYNQFKDEMEDLLSNDK